jgi:arylsulfatase A-like enzyme
VVVAGIVAAAFAAIGYVAWSRLHPATLPRDPGLSVLLVSIDTLRADALGAYGNARARTPWIDRLAREGVRFDAAHAHNVVTLPSHANMLTGLLPFEHGVRDNNGFRVPKDAKTLASWLKPRGYRSAGFVSAFVLDERFGLGSGFDRWDSRVAGGEWSRGFLMPERPAGRPWARRCAGSRPAAARASPSSTSTSRTRRTSRRPSSRRAPWTRTTARWPPRTPRSSRCCGRSWIRARAAARS